MYRTQAEGCVPPRLENTLWHCSEWVTFNVALQTHEAAESVLERCLKYKSSVCEHFFCPATRLTPSPALSLVLACTASAPTCSANTSCSLSELRYFRRASVQLCVTARLTRCPLSNAPPTNTVNAAQGDEVTRRTL